MSESSERSAKFIGEHPRALAKGATLARNSIIVRRQEMDTTTESVLAMAAALPGLYGVLCWVRRGFNARRAAEWARRTHQEEWNSLHWLAKRNHWAGVEVLVTKGLISGPEVEEYRARDEYLEKATWVGLFISAILLLVVLALRYAASTFG